MNIRIKLKIKLYIFAATIILFDIVIKSFLIKQYIFTASQESCAKSAAERRVQSRIGTITPGSSKSLCNLPHSIS